MVSTTSRRRGGPIRAILFAVCFAAGGCRRGALGTALVGSSAPDPAAARDGGGGRSSHGGTRNKVARKLDDSVVEGNPLCDKSACAGLMGSCDAVILVYPIACRNGRFSHPVLVDRVGEVIVSFDCCEADDGSLLASGLELSPGGFVRNRGFYLNTVPAFLISSASLLLLLVLVASILAASPKTRSDPFNAYIVLLAIPDLILNAWFVYANSMVLADVWPRVLTLPDVDISFFVGGTCTFMNIWINAILGYEVQKMVLRSHRRMGTDPPTTKRALLQGIAACFLSIIAGFNTWILLSVILPFVYLVYASFSIQKTGVLSLTGRSRSLTVYFGRIILVFVLFLIPGCFFVVMFGASPRYIWAGVLGTNLVSMQAGVTAVLAIMTKEDIRKSARKVIGLEALYGFQKKLWVSKVEKEKGWELTKAPDYILEDKDVVKAAIENNPSDALIEQAIRRAGWALEYATEAMRNNIDVVLLAVDQWGGALQYASEGIRSNDEVIVRAVKQLPTALQFALGGKNQSTDFLRAAGLSDDVRTYEKTKPRFVLSTRFSLGQYTSPTATIFALTMKKQKYFRRHFNVYFPNAYDKSTCDPEWTDINHVCRGTFETCQMPPQLKTGLPQECRSCWRYSYRYQLERAVAMIQVVEYYYAGEKAGNSEPLQEAGHIIGKGQNIETEMAALVGRKVFRCFQPVNEEGKKEEFDAYIMEDIASVVEKWYEEDPDNLEECNLRWKMVLGKWWLQESGSFDSAGLGSKTKNILDPVNEEAPLLPV